MPPPSSSPRSSASSSGCTSLQGTSTSSYKTTIRAGAYHTLVERFGAGSVADRLLQKWLTDPDADEKWEKLAAAVKVRYENDWPTWTYIDPFRINGKRPFKYWIVLWYFSMGYRNNDVAEQLGIAPNTVKRELQYARRRLNMIGEPMTAVVAKAIRMGKIP